MKLQYSPLSDGGLSTIGGGIAKPNPEPTPSRKVKAGATECWGETRSESARHYDDADKVMRCSKCGMATGVFTHLFGNDNTPCDFTKTERPPVSDVQKGEQDACDLNLTSQSI